MIDQALSRDHPHLEGITRQTLMQNGWARLNLTNDDGQIRMTFYNLRSSK